MEADDSFAFFLEKLLALDLFVIADEAYLAIEIRAIYDKLRFQYGKDTDFINNAVAKSTRNHFPVVNDENEFIGILSINDIPSA